MLYGIQATVVVNLPDGYTSTRQVPIFYLDSSIQGIVSAEHAERIAKSVVLAAAIGDTATAHVAIVSVEDM